ncbi:interferon-induced very large GTPase 1-like [Lampetra planeri]
MAQRDQRGPGAPEEQLLPSMKSIVEAKRPKEQLQSRNEHDPSAPAIKRVDFDNPAVISAKEVQTPMKNTSFEKLLIYLDLMKFYPQKLTLAKALQISNVTLSEEKPKCLKEVPMHFINNLLRANSSSRSIEFTNSETLVQDTPISTSNFRRRSNRGGKSRTSNSIDILDLITALFLCSDTFLQQALVVKMSQCQFALPLLLPDLNEGNIKFLVQAMQSVVHNWRPHYKLATKGYIEESMSVVRMPMIALVRLGGNTISKSELLNSILSNDKADIFIHRDMQSGNSRRQISNGLVEISFYFPPGDKRSDLWSDIFAVLNLRGDVGESPTQLHFLIKACDAMVILIENYGENEQKFVTTHFHSKMFWLKNTDVNDETDELLEQTLDELGVQDVNVCDLEKNNKADNGNLFREFMKAVLTCCEVKNNLKMISENVTDLNIKIDANNIKRQRSAEAIKDILQKMGACKDVRENCFPCQGETLWHKWSDTEKELCRLKKGLGPEYMNQLRTTKQNLRLEQMKQITPTMTEFISNISKFDEEECKLFIHGLELELNDKTRRTMREENKNVNAYGAHDISKELQPSNMKSSLSTVGLEHFFREVAQIYEASKECKMHQDYKNLSARMAHLFLDGFPMELLDGDAGCIPIDWVTDVFGEVNNILLGEVHNILKRDPRIFVLSVLGVQSSGKSTLLNTMFGLQFAVSSGRCTRGAFMQLLRIDNELTEELGFEFILVIDTEGLKALELSTLENSYEHDNELATLAIGLSNATILNVKMENAEEMKDILQIVVHAFLRMTEGGKKPSCVFVHQNSGGVSAHQKNKQDQERLLQILNEMTEAAAKMEEKSMYYKQFTDVIDYDAENDKWYIPGLWAGGSSRDRVSCTYSDEIWKLKKHLLEKLKKRAKLDNIYTLPEFSAWIKTMWTAMKKETYVFHFRNFLVLEAYNTLCTAYTGWELKLRMHMISWMQDVSNKVKRASHDELQNLKISLDKDVNDEILKQQCIFKDCLSDFFKKGSGKTTLVEKYREDFLISVRQLCSVVSNETLSKCKECIDTHECLESYRNVETQYKQTIGGKVKRVLENCTHSDKGLDEEQLQKIFNVIWSETVSDLKRITLQECDVKRDMEKALLSLAKTDAGLFKERLQSCSWSDMGRKYFKTLKTHSSGMHNKANSFEEKTALDSIVKLSSDIIDKCKQFITTKAHAATDYWPAYCDELLQQVDLILKNTPDDDKQYSKSFVIDIKMYVCSIAIEPFTKQHERFLKENDPSTRLEEIKRSYFNLLTSMCKTEDEKQRNVIALCDGCLKPAFLAVLKEQLGTIIVQDMMKNSVLSNRKALQATMLSSVLNGNNFDTLISFIHDSNAFTISAIKGLIIEHCTQRDENEEEKLYNIQCFAQPILDGIMAKLNNAILKETEHTESITVADLLEKLKSNLINDIVMKFDFLQIVGPHTLENPDKIKEFTKEVGEGIKRVSSEILKYLCGLENLNKLLDEMPVKPHEEIFKTVSGCGQHCPLCKAPCDRGGSAHREHGAAMHYPQGLCGKKCSDGTLIVDVCTTSVAKSKCSYRRAHSFTNEDTNKEWYEYRNYREVNDYYKSWDIPPETIDPEPVLWKFVFSKYNEKLAKKYETKSAKLPQEWALVTKEAVENNLKEKYGKIENINLFWNIMKKFTIDSLRYIAHGFVNITGIKKNLSKHPTSHTDSH